MQGQASCGVTPRPIAASPPWRRRTAIIFSGGQRETVEVLEALGAAPELLREGGRTSRRLPVLLGNSGVGKSLACAGRRARGPAGVRPGRERGRAGAWPAFSGSSPLVLAHAASRAPSRSRRWSRLFLQHLAARRHRSCSGAGAAEWVELRSLDGSATLAIARRRRKRRYEELNVPKPPAFFLYVDQGEELYVRAEERQRRRFSELLAQGPRRSAFASR